MDGQGYSDAHGSIMTLIIFIFLGPEITLSTFIVDNLPVSASHGKIHLNYILISSLYAKQQLHLHPHPFLK